MDQVGESIKGSLLQRRLSPRSQFRQTCLPESGNTFLREPLNGGFCRSDFDPRFDQFAGEGTRVAMMVREQTAFDSRYAARLQRTPIKTSGRTNQHRRVAIDQCVSTRRSDRSQDVRLDLLPSRCLILARKPSSRLPSYQRENQHTQHGDQYSSHFKSSTR